MESRKEKIERLRRQRDARLEFLAKFEKPAGYPAGGSSSPSCRAGPPSLARPATLPRQMRENEGKDGGRIEKNLQLII